MVTPTRVRHRAHKHAFEEALDEARETPEEDLAGFVDAALGSSVLHPAVGSFGDVAVASGYVAQSSLAKAYGMEGDAADGREAPPPPKPADAARKLMAELRVKALTPRELARIRRRFAAENHPDKVPVGLRREAVAAMAEVNAAIDKALKEARQP